MSGLTNYLDTDPRETSDSVLEQNKDNLLIFIMEKGVSYPTELSRHLNISIEGVNHLISYFARMGFLKNIIPNPENPQPEFKGRMLEFWSEGLWGYKSFSQRSWWTITLGGMEYLKSKYKGKHLSVKGSLKVREGLEEEKEEFKLPKETNKEIEEIFESKPEENGK